MSYTDRLIIIKSQAFDRYILFDDIDDDAAGNHKKIIKRDMREHGR